jgi:alginate O-acetyltransferase complex protein AlgI
MLLGGLWHGANWTFVIWGLYHGLLLIIDRDVERWLGAIPVVLRRAVTFALVVVGWVFFRSESLSMALGWLGKMAGIGSAGASTFSIALPVFVLVCFLLIHALPETGQIEFPTSRAWITVYATAFVVAYLFINGRERVFLYYQF